jgi:hypothetical protein
MKGWSGPRRLNAGVRFHMDGYVTEDARTFALFRTCVRL